MLKSSFAVTSPIVPLCLLGSVFQVLHAESVSRPVNLEASNEGALYQGTGMQNLVQPGFFSAQFQPFDSSLGTLVSFTVNCEIQGALDGSVDSGAETGRASGNMGGTFLIGGIAFQGTGGGSEVEEAGGSQLFVEFGIPAFEKELLPSDAGVNYDPQILALVTGDQPFDYTFSSGVAVDYESVVDLKAGVEAVLTMTYNYSPRPGALDTLRIVKIIRNTEAGGMEIEWTSEPFKTYRIEAGSGLEESDFSVIDPSVMGGEGATTTFIEGIEGAADRRRFYRVIENE